MTRLIIQIPCFNEADTITETIQALPRQLHGIESIEVLIVDDGSSDTTADVAAAAGAHFIKRLRQNQGLANAYSVGLDTCFRLGADIVVNTDADNQYCADDIEKLLKPILAGQADVVIGDRKTDDIEHFSPLKKSLQKWGSAVVRRASGTLVADSTSGFRALTRKAIESSFIHNRFSYTLESIVHAGSKGLKIENVAVRTNPQTRPSRLARGSSDYIKKNGPVILRSYMMYWPFQTFGFIASIFMVLGGALIVRFLYYYFQAPTVSSHIQSLQIGVGLTVIAFVILLLAILGDLIAANRRITEELLVKCRNIEARLERQDSAAEPLSGLTKTGHSPWSAS